MADRFPKPLVAVDEAPHAATTSARATTKASRELVIEAMLSLCSGQDQGLS
jgi:hypothetical protein